MSMNLRKERTNMWTYSAGRVDNGHCPTYRLIRVIVKLHKLTQTDKRHIRHWKFPRFQRTWLQWHGRVSNKNDLGIRKWQQPVRRHCNSQLENGTSLACRLSEQNLVYLYPLSNLMLLSYKKLRLVINTISVFKVTPCITVLWPSTAIQSWTWATFNWPVPIRPTTNEKRETRPTATVMPSDH